MRDVSITTQRKEKNMINYEINLETLALVPINSTQTKIYEIEKEFVINNNCLKIMENSCEYFGSSLEGRQKGTKRLIGVTHKSPIIIEESRNIIFFPTSSPRLNNCCWISLNNLEQLAKNQTKSLLLFKNTKKLNLNISYGILDNQILRATRLESVIRKRIKNK